MVVKIISVNFFPQEFGIAPFATDLALKLTEKNKVIVVTARAFDQRFSRISDDRFQELRNPNLTVQRVPTYLFSKSTFLNRVLFDTLFFLGAFLSSLRSNRDSNRLVIISPPLQLGLIGVILKRLFRKEYIFYVQDIVPDLPMKLGIIKNKVLLKFLYFIERVVYADAMKIITISDGLKDNITSKLRSLGIEKQVDVISNWANIGPEIAVTSSNNDFPGIPDKKVALYAGSFGRKQAFEDIAPLFGKFRDGVPELHFCFVGDGPNRKEFECKLKSLRIDNYTFLPPMRREAVKVLEQKCCMVFVSQNPAITNELFPSKLVSAFSSGKPVLAIAHPKSDIAKMIRSTETGVVIDAEQMKTMGERDIRKLLKPLLSEQNRTKMSRNAFGFAKAHYDKSHVLERIEHSILEGGDG